MSEFGEAFFCIPGQWLGISFVVGFSTFFMLWVSYGIVVQYTHLLQRWWGVPSKLDIGGFDKSTMTMRFQTQPVSKNRFKSCLVFLRIHSADVTHSMIKTAATYRRGRRIDGGEELIEGWKNLEQVNFQLQLDAWKPGEPLQGSFQIPTRALKKGTQEQPVVNLFELVFRHPLFGEERLELPLDFSKPLTLTGSETKKEELAEVPYGGYYWQPHMQLRTFMALFLAAFLAMMTPLGVNLWVQRHYLSQETSIQKAYQYLARDEMEPLVKTITQISAVPLPLRGLDKYKADSLEAEIAGFRIFQSQRQGSYSTSEPEFGAITPPIEWINRAEFFLNQGNAAQSGEQLGAILAKTETAPLAFDYILLLLNRLEKAGQINKAKELGKIVLKKLKDENINPERSLTCKALFAKLGIWFPEDPSLY